MRVEMYGMNWNDDWDKPYHAAIRTDVAYYVSTAGRIQFQFIPDIAADSGETTGLKMTFAVLNINLIIW